jgi:hypothetical protein
MAKKLSLDEIRVQSFVTILNEEDLLKVSGGVDTDATPNCTVDCTTHCASTTGCYSAPDATCCTSCHAAENYYCT